MCGRKTGHGCVVGASSWVAQLVAKGRSGPSPQPSPAGRGSSLLPASKPRNTACRVPVRPPRPAGEGWGEGERRVQRTDSIRVRHRIHRRFGWACGLCPGEGGSGAPCHLALRTGGGRDTARSVAKAAMNRAHCLVSLALRAACGWLSSLHYGSTTLRDSQCVRRFRSEA